MARERVTAAGATSADWHEFASRAELAEALAQRVSGRLSQAADERGTGFLAVSGGTTKLNPAG